MQLNSDIPARRGGTEARLDGTEGVPGLDQGGNPDTKVVEQLDMVDSVWDTRPGSWGFLVEVSGAVAMAARIRASWGSQSG